MQHKKGQNPYFKLKDIAKTFGITKALNGVTLDIYAGEVIGLVGPNGAGKSTLMKILTGILPQTDGTIEIEGRTEEHYNTKLAKKYGEDSSKSFVNGVLASIVKERNLDKEE